MGIFHEAVGELRDVHEPVLVHADIDERSEVRDVGHHALELHTGPQVLNLLDTLLEFRRLEFGSRIASRLFELGQDVLRVDPAARTVREHQQERGLAWLVKLDFGPSTYLYAARVFDPPIAAEMIDGRGRPIAVSGRGEQMAAPAYLRSKVVCGDVTGWAGPWASDVRWWDPDARNRCARYQLTVGEPNGSEVACLVVLENGTTSIEAIYD